MMMLPGVLVVRMLPGMLGVRMLVTRVLGMRLPGSNRLRPTRRNRRAITAPCTQTHQQPNCYRIK